MIIRPRWDAPHVRCFPRVFCAWPCLLRQVGTALGSPYDCVVIGITYTNPGSRHAVLADSGPIHGLLLTVLADSGSFRKLLCTIGDQSDFHDIRSPASAYVLFINTVRFGRFWPGSLTITHRFGDPERFPRLTILVVRLRVSHAHL